MILGIILILTMFAAIFKFGRIELRIEYIKNSARDCLKVTVYVLGVWKIYQEVKQDCLQSWLDEILGKLASGLKASGKAGSQKIKRSGSGFHRLSWRQLTGLPWTCRKLSLKIKVSSEDAAQTALAFGVIHAMKSLAYQWLRGKVRFQALPELAVEPFFNGGERECVLRCIVSVKIGNFISILKNCN